MKDRKEENSTNDEINLQTDALVDLPVADAPADETKGGATKGSTSDIYLMQDYTNAAQR